MKTKLVIFGITGDLSTRKLLPALEHITGMSEFEDLSIIGVSRREVNASELLHSSLGHDNFAHKVSIFTMDLAKPSDYVRLKESLGSVDDEQIVIYLSVPPNAAAQIVDLLGEAGLNSANVKIMFEKPFGFDLQSAQDFIDRTSRYFSENQMYRIDHYMAKEVAQEIIRLRSNAENHHHSWGNHSIKSVEIVASEKIGVEDRAVFYEQTGALRDFVQGHLMQLLSLVLMEAPSGEALEDLPAYRLGALQKLMPADPSKAVRGQYEGYGVEVGNEGSLVETFASLQLESSDEHWTGVNLRLTTGKSLNEKRSYIKVRYNDDNEDIFDEAQLTSGDKRVPDAYERVLIEAMNGNKNIFTTSQEVLASWRVVQPVQEAWEMSDELPKIYAQRASLSDILG
jgi:glucose-6-phosphate 1-dehydrogenase